MADTITGIIWGDRVHVESVTSGTGSLTITNTMSGFQSIATGIGESKQAYYAAVQRGGSQWEQFRGTYNTTTQVLTRDRILANSSSTSALNWDSGVKDVFVGVPSCILNRRWNQLTVASTSAPALDCERYGHFHITASSNFTPTFNFVQPSMGFYLHLTVGSTNLSCTFPTTRFSGGAVPTPSVTTGRVDSYFFLPTTTNSSDCLAYLVDAGL